MLKSGFYITAELKITNSNKISETVQCLKKLCEQTVLESGCTLFQLHQCLNDPTRLLLWERYNTEADYNYHFEQGYTKAYLSLNLTEVIQCFKSNIICND
ncbi:carboxymuconolactone decarboxylase [Acinetobacter sp. 194]|uniref:putative quinol monooxygenase n=1 Tax=Acinetobacter shaoyimingii TaxID=2715164 RepID=UPI00140DD9AD|nr:antibiotic biosynthesis monooxygenase [Acinetobacter shaoyimingii]NHB59422.1 carboxymuconolactone decarboxylase [Acinetobacter shaoyimingii]